MVVAAAAVVVAAACKQSLGRTVDYDTAGQVAASENRACTTHLDRLGR